MAKRSAKLERFKAALKSLFRVRIVNQKNKGGSDQKFVDEIQAIARTCVLSCHTSVPQYCIIVSRFRQCMPTCVRNNVLA